jgi:hypothetical protein
MQIEINTFIQDLSYRMLEVILLKISREIDKQFKKEISD